MTVNKDHILLIDDSEANNLLNKRLIKKFVSWCASVQEVLNGLNGIDYLLGKAPYTDRQKYPLPSVIFLDVNMPVLDGFEFMTIFNTLDKSITGNIKVVMLTSSILDEDEQRAKDMSVDLYLTKPLTKPMLENLTVRKTS